MERKFIPLSVPNFPGNEVKYVSDAVASTWVSTAGPLIPKFEKAMAEYMGTDMVVATNSGTAALHLSLVDAGVGPGDEVICAALTFIAAVNPVRFCGGEPVFVDCDKYFCMDPDSVQYFIDNYCEMVDGKLINKTTGAHVKGMIPVHVFGNMANMERLMDIAEKYNLFVLEDATESVGTFVTEGRYKGRHLGTIGHYGALSFNGNKVMTTGGGGMAICHNEASRHNMAVLSEEAQDMAKKEDNLLFIHTDVGYNYRMNNIAAALGLAQLEHLEDFVATKNRNFAIYKELLDGKNGLKMIDYTPGIRSSMWFHQLYLDDCKISRNEMIESLAQRKIQSRPIWLLNPDQAPYKNSLCMPLPNARDYVGKIVNIPCSSNLTEEEVRIVCAEILDLTK
ncbi:MAG: aminotransferase class I/II-fold pyridoxal phosphate-dependent enzyme [Oscillospiraceae bacterium]|nr:aminotransferase class I/II-fold pyridoxal phosphate-dependent enzyme [Oscillospiraceae bacterium]